MQVLLASIWESNSLTLMSMVVNMVTLLEESVHLEIVQTNTPD